MFGIQKKIERVREALISGLNRKAFAIMIVHRERNPADIPALDLARATILNDIADVLKDVDLSGASEE